MIQLNNFSKRAAAASHCAESCGVNVFNSKEFRTISRAAAWHLAREKNWNKDTPEQFAQYIKSEAAKWGKVIKALNLKID